MRKTRHHTTPFHFQHFNQTAKLHQSAWRIWPLAQQPGRWPGEGPSWLTGGCPEAQVHRPNQPNPSWKARQWFSNNHATIFGGLTCSWQGIWCGVHQVSYQGFDSPRSFTDQFTILWKWQQRLNSIAWTKLQMVILRRRISWLKLGCRNWERMAESQGQNSDLDHKCLPFGFYSTIAFMYFTQSGRRIDNNFDGPMFIPARRRKPGPTPLSGHARVQPWLGTSRYSWTPSRNQQAIQR